MGENDARVVYPRVLVISNNCFSSSGSNGRTLANLFSGWPASELAQFYIAPQEPDSSVCTQYFRVTDREALRSLCGRGGPVGGPIGVDNGEMKENSAVRDVRPIAKTPTTSLVRHIVWSLGSWRRRGFMSWVEAFNPRLLLLQAGDAPFLFALARDLAHRLKVPLVILSTEDYYFKTQNYMLPSRHKILSSLSYAVFSRVLSSQARRAFAATALAVLNSDGLRLLHEKEFGVRAETVMPLTSLKPRTTASKHPLPTLSYLGNLGHGRHVSLMEIGAALQRIDSRLHLDVYGRTPEARVRADLESAPGVRYEGVVPYDQVVAVLHRVDVLVHAESFLDCHRMQIKYAFSTKLADYMASGACVFVYAPPELLLTRYLEDTGAAAVVTDPVDLERTLERLISSEAERLRYAEQALMVAARNHSSERNIDRFQTILSNVVTR